MRWRQRFFRRDLTEKRLDAELLFHLEQRIVDLMGGGMAPGEARRQARIEFGGLDQVKEECRDVGGSHVVEMLVQDMRYGLRQLRRNPGFTAVAVVTLALGIGTTTAIFSVINGVLLKPLVYPHSNQLVNVSHTALGWNLADAGASPSTYFIYREESRTFEDIGIYAGDSVNITGFGEPERVGALDVTDGILPILGTPPILGRWFSRADDSPSGADTVMLTFGYWQRKFSGDRSVIGKTITVDGKLRQIIGVMPQNFHFLDWADPALILPYKLDRAKTFLGDFGLPAVARLKPGVTLAQANADVTRMLPIVQRSFPPPPGFSRKFFEDARIRPDLQTLKQNVVGNVEKILWVLMAGIGMVLLIACANVGNLLLVRGEGRRQEFAIRAALGAGRRRITAQLLFESLVLALLGSVLGLVLAYAVLRFLVAVAPTGLPRLNEIGIDGTVVLFTLAVSFVASLLTGSVLISKCVGRRPGNGLRETGRLMSEGSQRQRTRSALVTVQVALTLVLLVSSGLMVRTFRALTGVDLGFVAPSKVQTFRVEIPETEVKDPGRVARVQEEILQKVVAIPGVDSVSLSNNVPMAMDGSGWNDPVFVEGRTHSSGELPLRRFMFISPGYFKTLGTPLIVGRDFNWSDIFNRFPVAIVSEKLARTYWQEPVNALGKRIRASEKDDWREVIGVAEDIHDDGVNEEPPTTVYWPILRAHFMGHPDADVQRYVAFIVRSARAGSESLMNEVRQAVWSVDSSLPLADVHTLDYYYKKSMARTSFTLVMLAVAGGMALLLGIVGLHGVISYSISLRTHEIGVRMALGAEKRDVLRMVISRGLRLALIGVAIGIAGAFALTRFLSSLLYGVTPTDPLTFIAVSLILIVVALLACYIPARRATKVDPIAALRYE